MAEENSEATIRRLIADVTAGRISKLARNPLPFRKLNHTRPGQQKRTLHEADDFLADHLTSRGYQVQREGVQVQAYRRDPRKPKQQQYAPPRPEDPWYTAYNLHAEGDIPERCDIENAAMVVRATLAAILTLDAEN